MQEFWYMTGALIMWIVRWMVAPLLLLAALLIGAVAVLFSKYEDTYIQFAMYTTFFPILLSAAFILGVFIATGRLNT